MNNQDKMPVVKALKEFVEKEPAYFCVPGHRFGKGVSEKWVSKDAREILRFDLTEATGLDDLHQPSGVIREAQGLMSQLFHARKSFFLVNGTTCGNQAMMLSTVNAGDKILVPRNAHKSILAGLVLSGATPVYVMPRWNEKWGIWGGVSPAEVEKILKEQRDIKGVFVVSPSYYGVVDKVAEISTICKKYNCLCMVDEAHGAHLYFAEDLPKGALTQGADMCVQSFHKVAGSLTQSSVLHVNSDKVNTSLLQNNLQMLQSSSPSYLLMASLDAARHELSQNGKEMCDKVLLLAQYARSEISQIKGIRCMGKEEVGKYEIADIDLTKVVITAMDLGISGFTLKEMLTRDYGVEVELADNHNILAVLTFANSKAEVKRLVDALAEIAKGSKVKDKVQSNEVAAWPAPEMKLTPREAQFSKVKIVAWQDAVGKVAAEEVTPYPPGIPIVNRGELISQEVWDCIERLRRAGCHFHGALGKETKDEISIVEC